jgi:hypothetical protein
MFTSAIRAFVLAAIVLQSLVLSPQVGKQPPPAKPKSLRLSTQPQSVQDLQLSNAYLALSLVNTGQFTLQTPDGQYLLYPGGYTSYLSVKVDSQVYTNYPEAGTQLSTITPLTQVDADTAFIDYVTPEGIVIHQQYNLSGQAVTFQVTVTNTDTGPHAVSVRYLLDTEVGYNDGAPLFSTSTGEVISETDIPSPNFDRWESYDQFPNPTLTAVGTFETRPNRAVFAWWPNANQYTWDYTPNSDQAFFTPGYISSPESDSCVLLYFDLGSLTSGVAAALATSYGVGPTTVTDPRSQLLAAFDVVHSSLRNSMIADAQALAATIASFHVATKVSLRDYAQLIWSIASIPLPGPDKLGKLGQDAAILSDFADALGAIDQGTSFGAYFANLTKGISDSMSEDQVRETIYNGIMSSMPFRDPNTGITYIGMAGLLNQLDSDYAAYRLAIPNPLTYPVSDRIQFLQRQKAALDASAIQPTPVPACEPNHITCAQPDIELGELQRIRDAMKKLASILQTTGDVSFDLSVVNAGVWVTGGLVKIGGIFLAPETLGVSEVAAEATLWTTVAGVAAIPDIMSIPPTATSLSTKGAMTELLYKSLMQYRDDLGTEQEILKEDGVWLDTASLANTATSIQHIASSSSLTVTVNNISIPNLTVADNAAYGVGTGQLLLTNGGSTSINASLFGELTMLTSNEMAVIGLVSSSAAEVPAGQQISLPFSFKLFRSTLVSSTGYDAHLTVIAADSGGNSQAFGPFQTHFFVGTASQLEILNDNSSKPIAQGQLGIGQIASYPVQFPSGTQLGRLTLSFPKGSVQDLHLYDSLGRHVGLNYATGLVEDQIPNASYSGPNVDPEWIQITLPPTDVFTATVVSEGTEAGDNFDLSQLEIKAAPAILDVSPSISWSYERPSRAVTSTDSFGFSISEGGGSQEFSSVSITPSNLISGSYMISDAQIACATLSGIAPGTSVVGTCSITVTPALLAGIYTGSLSIVANSLDENPLHATAEMQFNLTEPIWKMYMPVILRRHIETKLN